MKTKRQTGFTLFELVLSIIFVIGGVVVFVGIIIAVVHFVWKAW